MRLDAAAEQALRTLTSSGATRSEVVRGAHIELGRAERHRAELVAEVRALEADPVDQAEQRAVASFMVSIGDGPAADVEATHHHAR